MRTVYLDEQFRCFVSDDGTRLPVETEAFDGKCDAFVEGYRFIPAGKCWMRRDGTLFWRNERAAGVLRCPGRGPAGI